MWSTFERTFFDVRIFNAKSLSYQSKILPQLYNLYEKENKNRVLQLEIGLFIPLIFTTTGAMCNIRTRLSMEIMRSVLVAVRFVCGKAKKVWTAPISIVSFNLIPDEKSF